MQFIHIHRRAGAIVAVAFAALAMSVSAASARPLEAPIHQAELSGPAAPPVLAPVAPSDLRATEVQKAHAYAYSVPATARYSNAEFNTFPRRIPAVAVSKIAVTSNDFHWDDAAIGAAIAVGAVLLLTLGGLAVRRRTQLGEA
jgi:hypothetical protein